MLKDYLSTARYLREQVPALVWIDLDKGQLDGDNADQYHSLINPSVIIGFPEIEWELAGRNLERGEGFMSIKSAFVLQSQTYEMDKAIDFGLEVLALADDVHDAMMAMPGVVSRTTTKCYPVLTYFVIEHTYRVAFVSGGRKLKAVSVPVSINPVIHKP